MQRLVINPHMTRAAAFFIVACVFAGSALAQDVGPSPEPKRGWLSRLNPFHRERLPEYGDPKLRGLKLDVQLSPQPVKLSEVRQLQVRFQITNLSKKPIELQFPDSQRIEIQLRSSADVVLIKWSENRTFQPQPASVMINPAERIEYLEPIATRELSPNKVYIAEVFVPPYPDLNVRQKFMTAE